MQETKNYIKNIDLLFKDINYYKIMMQEIVAIVDRSGSMAGKEEDTVGGINATIDELKNNKNENENINFSLKFFDHESYLRIRSMDITKVKPIPVSDLRPRGQTAILMQWEILFFILLQKKLQIQMHFNSRVIYVATDGLENCSKRYTNVSLKNLIESAANYGITILYLAANQDAILEANKFGLNADNAINYSETKETTENVYRAAGRAAKRVRTGQPAAFLHPERTASQV